MILLAMIMPAMIMGLAGTIPAGAADLTCSLRAGDWTDKFRPRTFPPDRPRSRSTVQTWPIYLQDDGNPLSYAGGKEIERGHYAEALSEINGVLRRSDFFRPRLIDLLKCRENLETIKERLTEKEKTFRSRRTETLLHETDETLARFAEAIYKERRRRLATELGRQAIELETRGESKEASQRLDDILAIHREGSFDRQSWTSLLVDLARTARTAQSFTAASGYYGLALDSIGSGESPDDERLRVIILEGLAEALNRNGESEKAEKIYEELRRR